MNHRRWLWILIIASLWMSLVDFHDWRTARYWRKQYDQQKAAYRWAEADRRNLLDEVSLPFTITLAKTCIDEFGNETTPVAATKLVLDEDRKASKVELPHCPKGTVDVNVYLGRN